MRLLIGIPAHNEQQTIGAVIDSLPKSVTGFKVVDVVVVDDGSTDDTRFILSRKKVTVLTHLVNRGLGGALKTILAYARQNDYDCLVTFDADGQHQARDIVRLTEPIRKGQDNVVIGSRWISNKTTHFLRRSVNSAANWLTFALFGVWTTDSQSGLRAFDKKALDLIQIQADGMEVSSEFFKEIFRHKLKIMEIPIQPIYTAYSKAKGQKITNGPYVFFQLLLRFLK